MKRSRVTGSKILAVLKQAEAGKGVPDLCREHGISSATFYRRQALRAYLSASLGLRDLSHGDASPDHADDRGGD